MFLVQDRRTTTLITLISNVPILWSCSLPLKRRGRKQPDRKRRSHLRDRTWGLDVIGWLVWGLPQKSEPLGASVLLTTGLNFFILVVRTPMDY